jgi:hypothetical protein
MAAVSVLPQKRSVRPVRRASTEFPLRVLALTINPCPGGINGYCGYGPDLGPKLEVRSGPHSQETRAAGILCFNVQGL